MKEYLKLNTKNNSADRILKILEKVHQSNPNLQMLDIWADVFHIKNTTNNKKYSEVSLYLGLLHDEVEFLRKAMISQGYSEKLYSPYLNTINNIILIQKIDTKWQSLNGSLSQAVILSVGFCAEILPSDEKEIITQEDHKEIIDLIIELEQELQKDDIPEHLSKIITNIIDKLKKTLNKGIIIGAKSFDEAASILSGEIYQNKSDLKDLKDNPVMEKMGEIWSKLQKYANEGKALEGAISTGKKLVKHGEEGLNFINTFFS